jgi:hypothetical protein
VHADRGRRRVRHAVAGALYRTFGTALAGSHVAGYLDVYSFTTPGGGRVTLPCVVLVDGITTVDPCAGFGGTFSSRMQVLTETDMTEPAPDPDVPATTVDVCTADLVLTVEAIGITSTPAYTVC